MMVGDCPTIMETRLYPFASLCIYIVLTLDMYIQRANLIEPRRYEGREVL